MTALSIGLLKFIPVIAAFSLLTSCESKGGANDDAFENFQVDKMMTGDSATVQEPEKLIIESEVPKHRKDKKEILDEWAQFNADMEIQMTSNENKIGKIKAIPQLNADSFNKVVSLEKDNYGMRLELNNYVEVDVNKHEKFKEKFAERMNTITISLEELDQQATINELMLH